MGENKMKKSKPLQKKTVISIFLFLLFILLSLVSFYNCKITTNIKEQMKKTNHEITKIKKDFQKLSQLTENKIQQIEKANHFDISSLFFQKYKVVEKDLVINLFKSAKKEAQKNKIMELLIFLDQCDTIFTDLGSLEANSDTAKNVVNQFKTELTSNENDVLTILFLLSQQLKSLFRKLDEAIKSRFDYKTEVKVGDFKNHKDFLEFMIKKRGNEYSEKAKNYLVEDINNKLNELLLSREKEIKSNRVLENFLKVITRVNERAINISNTNRGNSVKITIEDIQKAYAKVYNTDEFPEPILKRVIYKSDDKTIDYIEKYEYDSNEKI
uniref:ATP-binding protein n=1 Tax=Milkweed yellows phytoplasma TaxID=208434 RepID=UPI001C9DCB77